MTLTNQQVFDNALNQVRKQNYMRSRSDFSPGCAYRGEHGLKCALGASIPDSLYDPDIEGKTATQLLQLGCFRELFRGVSGVLLSDLQRLHDSAYVEQIANEERISEGEFEAGMMLLASKYDLAYTRP